MIYTRPKYSNHYFLKESHVEKKTKELFNKLQYKLIPYTCKKQVRRTNFQGKGKKHIKGDSKKLKSKEKGTLSV